MNSWVAITGSSNGIGAALAEVFAHHKYSVVLHGRNQCDLQAMREKILSTGQQTTIVNGDIRDQQTRDALIRHSLEKDIALFVNNVGYRCPGVPLQDLTDTQIDEMFKVNDVIQVKLTRDIYRHFMRRGTEGCFMYINSNRGLEPKEGRSIYCGSRFGMRGFSASFRKEAQPYGIRVLNVYAARIRTKPEFTYGWNVTEAAEKMYQHFASGASNDLILDSGEKEPPKENPYPLPDAAYFFSR